MSTEPKRPMAGEWWFHNDSEPGDSATSRALLVKCVLDDGMLVVQASSNSGHSIMDPVDFRSMHHEPRCTGWDWVVPEREKEKEANESADHLLLLTAEHDYLKSALKNVRTEMRKVFGVTTRRFAAICGVSCEQLSKWTGDVPEEQPDFVCKPENSGFSVSFNNSWGKDEKFANVVTGPPDDWVTQDRVPARPGIDERRYVGANRPEPGRWEDAKVLNWDRPAIHGAKSVGGDILELRCRRKDYPTVTETGEAVVPMFGMKIVDADRVATEVRNEWSMGQKPAEAMNWVGDALGAVEKKQDEVADVVEIPVWLVTRPSGKRYLVVDDVCETLSDDKVQECRPMRLEVLK